MVHLFSYDEDLVTACVEEFVQAKFPGSEYAFACIYRSHNDPDIRQVFLVEVAGQHFALKLDLDSPETGFLAHDYETVLKLKPHFDNHERVAVIEPVYLSPKEHFLVTEYVGRKTASDAITDAQQENRAAQIYRRAGEWLHVLHSFKSPTQEPFYPQRVFEPLENLIAAQDIRAPSGDYEPMIAQLRKDAVRLEGIPELCVFSSGDCHGKNLIIDQGCIYGLDFAYAKDQHAVHDIVDFLRIDIHRDGNPSELDRCGILKHNKEMFFKLYRHPINLDILDLCMRAALLKAWLTITPERYEAKPSLQVRFERLRERLHLTFEIPF